MLTTITGANMKDFDLTNAIIPVKQKPHMRRQEVMTIVMITAVVFAAFFLIAPAFHWAIFHVLNWITGKQVPIDFS